ncbi:hypothetical protein [Roseobacter sp. HKCCA0434]|uniref:hypothetical protein n=1 Tax=Roseobacter sp. HKCCA0434 TaxID=3079297 RepID=UPI002905E657|nr:hypothetical protein [Roseobacter sp. HKCCA0434]
MSQSNDDALGNEIAAQISGEAAGMLTWLMERCAAIAGDITEERMDAVRAGLASDRADLTGAQDVFDTHFQIGVERAEAGEAPEPTETSCAQAIELLRSDESVGPPR